MHDATSRKKGINVSKTRCHEKEIQCVNRGLGHMGMQEKGMAMPRRTNQTRNLGAYVHERHAWRQSMWPMARACERGLSTTCSLSLAHQVATLSLLLLEDELILTLDSLGDGPRGGDAPPSSMQIWSPPFSFLPKFGINPKKIKEQALWLVQLRGRGRHVWLAPLPPSYTRSHPP